MMHRRDFLAASGAAVVGAAGLAVPQSAGAQDAKPSGKQLIELRTYHFASPDKRDDFAEFLTRAMMPALERAGVGPVGAFELLAKDNPALKLAADSNDLYIVLSYDSFGEFVGLPDRMAADFNFLQAGLSVLTAPKSDPAFTRYESQLMLGFDQCPRVEAPMKAASRLLQLRIYESHSTERAKKKIAMFNEGGEIAIFRRLEMHPVFFGQSLTGSKLPNLTYMLAFEDQQAMDNAWNAFRGDPEWKMLSADEQYKDTVSNITNLVLRPIEGSGI